MNFSENLINLRKANGMSQEALAEKLGVSRQTIYKWENGITYPDMDKVMDIAKIFKVTVDSLVSEEAICDISKEEIIKRVNVFAKGIGLAIFIIMFGVAILIGFTAFENMQMLFGIVIMLLFVFGAVLLIILLGVRFENFKRQFEPKIEFTKQEKVKEDSRFTRNLILGLASIFLGVILLILSLSTQNNMIILLAVSLLLILVGIGVFFIVSAGLMHDLYTKGNDFLLLDELKKKSKLDGLSGVIMIISTIVFFVWGFAFDGWKLSWIAFPIGGLLCGVVSIISDCLKKNAKEKEQHKAFFKTVFLPMKIAKITKNAKICLGHYEKDAIRC